MVTLHVGGRQVGTLADAERLIPEFLARKQRVEFRDTDGTPIGTLDPAPPESLVPWDPTITAEEIERRMAEPGLTFEEMKKRLGWE